MSVRVACTKKNVENIFHIEFKFNMEIQIVQ